MRAHGQLIDGWRFPLARASSHLRECSSTMALPHDLMTLCSHCVQSCNQNQDKKSEFLPFVVEGHRVGYIHPSFADQLRRFSKIFVFNNKDSRVELHDNLKSPNERTAAVDKALLELRDEGLIPGWRDEKYPVVLKFDSPAFFSVERAAAPFFGTKAYGVHMNGYVNSSGNKRLWVAKRSQNKQTYPGLLDHLVAGGQPVGLSCEENIIKECGEEASIPISLSRQAIPVGAVSYENISGQKFQRDVLFCYDLELPPDFTPLNTDGEVESFSLHSISDVMQSLHLYKPNCSLVVIHFLFRHGYIKPEQQGYLQLLRSLTMGECF